MVVVRIGWLELVISMVLVSLALVDTLFGRLLGQLRLQADIRGHTRKRVRIVLVQTKPTPEQLAKKAVPRPIDWH